MHWQSYASYQRVDRACYRWNHRLNQMPIKCKPSDCFAQNRVTAGKERTSKSSGGTSLRRYYKRTLSDWINRVRQRQWRTSCCSFLLVVQPSNGFLLQSLHDRLRPVLRDQQLIKIPSRRLPAYWPIWSNQTDMVQLYKLRAPPQSQELALTETTSSNFCHNLED